MLTICNLGNDRANRRWSKIRWSYKYYLIYNHNVYVKQPTYQQWVGQAMQERAEEVVEEDWPSWWQ